MSYKKISLDNGIEVVTDKETIKMTSGEISLSPTDESIKTALTAKTTESLDDLHIHKAADGTLYAATGATAPKVWPDQEPEHPGEKHEADETVLSVDKDGNVTNVPEKPPEYYGN